MITIVIPIFISNSDMLKTTQECITNLKENTVNPFNLMVIDNDSIPEAEAYFKNLNLPNLIYVKHEEHPRGIIEAVNEAWKTTTTPLLCFMHNDFYILEKGWDNKVYEIFNGDPKLGIIGFGGGYGINVGVVRSGFTSNMVDAEVHGARRTEGYMPAAVLDGMILIMSRKMLDSVQGIGHGYRVHHMYDYHISLASIAAGFHNYVLFIKCKHKGMGTIMFPSWGKWAKDQGSDYDYYMHNRKIFLELWSCFLPIRVSPDFSLSHS